MAVDANAAVGGAPTAVMIAQAKERNEWLRAELREMRGWRGSGIDKMNLVPRVERLEALQQQQQQHPRPKARGENPSAGTGHLDWPAPSSQHRPDIVSTTPAPSGVELVRAVAIEGTPRAGSAVEVVVLFADEVCDGVYTAPDIREFHIEWYAVVPDSRPGAAPSLTSSETPDGCSDSGNPRRYHSTSGVGGPGHARDRRLHCGAATLLIPEACAGCFLRVAVRPPVGGWFTARTSRAVGHPVPVIQAMEVYVAADNDVRGEHAVAVASIGASAGVGAEGRHHADGRVRDVDGASSWHAGTPLQPTAGSSRCASPSRAVSDALDGGRVESVSTPSTTGRRLPTPPSPPPLPPPPPPPPMAGETLLFRYLVAPAAAEAPPRVTWYRDGVEVLAAAHSGEPHGDDRPSSIEYGLTAADVGRIITLSVLPVAADGTEGAPVAVSTPPVAPARPVVTEVEICGTPVVGGTLTARICGRLLHLMDVAGSCAWAIGDKEVTASLAVDLDADDHCAEVTVACGGVTAVAASTVALPPQLSGPARVGEMVVLAGAPDAGDLRWLRVDPDNAKIKVCVERDVRFYTPDDDDLGCVLEVWDSAGRGLLARSTPVGKDGARPREYIAGDPVAGGVLRYCGGHGFVGARSTGGDWRHPHLDRAHHMAPAPPAPPPAEEEPSPRQAHCRERRSTIPVVGSIDSQDAASLRMLQGRRRDGDANDSSFATTPPISTVSPPTRPLAMRQHSMLSAGTSSHQTRHVHPHRHPHSVKERNARIVWERSVHPVVGDAYADVDVDAALGWSFSAAMERPRADAVECDEWAVVHIGSEMYLGVEDAGHAVRAWREVVGGNDGCSPLPQPPPPVAATAGTAGDAAAAAPRRVAVPPWPAAALVPHAPYGAATGGGGAREERGAAGSTVDPHGCPIVVHPADALAGRLLEVDDPAVDSSGPPLFRGLAVAKDVATSPIAGLGEDDCIAWETSSNGGLSWQPAPAHRGRRTFTPSADHLSLCVRACVDGECVGQRRVTLTHAGAACVHRDVRKGVVGFAAVSPLPATVASTRSASGTPHPATTAAAGATPTAAPVDLVMSSTSIKVYQQQQQQGGGAGEPAGAGVDVGNATEASTKGTASEPPPPSPLIVRLQWSRDVDIACEGSSGCRLHAPVGVGGGDPNASACYVLRFATPRVRDHAVLIFRVFKALAFADSDAVVPTKLRKAWRKGVTHGAHVVQAAVRRLEKWLATPCEDRGAPSPVLNVVRGVAAAAGHSGTPTAAWPRPRHLDASTALWAADRDAHANGAGHAGVGGSVLHAGTSPPCVSTAVPSISAASPPVSPRSNTLSYTHLSGIATCQSVSSPRCTSLGGGSTPAQLGLQRGTSEV